MVLRLNVFNNGNSGGTVQIYLRSNEPEDLKDTANVWFPDTCIHFYMKANTQQTVAYFLKLHPNRPFGQYRVDFQVESDEVVIAEERPDQNQYALLPSENNNNNHQGDQTMDPYSDDQIQCTACTIFNPLSSEKCYMCESVLPHRL